MLKLYTPFVSSRLSSGVFYQAEQSWHQASASPGSSLWRMSPCPGRRAWACRSSPRLWFCLPGVGGGLSAQVGPCLASLRLGNTFCLGAAGRKRRWKTFYLDFSNQGKLFVFIFAMGKKMVLLTWLSWCDLGAGYRLISQGGDHLFLYCGEVLWATGLASFRSSEY